MLIVNTEQIPGKEFESIGIVKGSIVHSKHVGKDLKTMFGGETKAYTEILSEARTAATNSMVKEAESLGGNAIINVRYTSGAVAHGVAEILVYGTVVKFI